MICLDNKVALITGGGRGIGRGIAMMLAAAGADIVIADLNCDNTASVVKEIEAMGRKALGIQCDVTDTGSIKQGVQAAINYFEHIDVLVNNAGICPVEDWREENMDQCDEDMDRCYQLNLKSVWQVSNALIPHFGTLSGGKIINIASPAGRQGSAICPAYSASKAAVINLTQSFAKKLGPDNINVNAICPGLVKTTMTEAYPALSGNPNFFDDFAKEHTCLKRMVTEEDIAKAVTFLSSSLANNITGQSLNVDGGFVMN